MKAEKEKTGLFRRLVAAVVGNWGLKLLALALAIIVYHSLKTKTGRGPAKEGNDRHILQYR